MINKIKDKLFEVLSSNYENQIVDNAAAVLVFKFVYQQ